MVREVGSNPHVDQPDLRRVLNESERAGKLTGTTDENKLVPYRKDQLGSFTMGKRRVDAKAPYSQKPAEFAAKALKRLPVLPQTRVA